MLFDLPEVAGGGIGGSPFFLFSIIPLAGGGGAVLAHHWWRRQRSWFLTWRQSRTPLLGNFIGRCLWSCLCWWPRRRLWWSTTTCVQWNTGINKLTIIIQNIVSKQWIVYSEVSNLIEAETFLRTEIAQTQNSRTWLYSLTPVHCFLGLIMPFIWPLRKYQKRQADRQNSMDIYHSLHR